MEDSPTKLVVDPQHCTKMVEEGTMTTVEAEVQQTTSEPAVDMPHYNETTSMILQGCPATSSILCDSVSTFVDMLSFEDAEEREDLSTTQQHKMCLTPRSTTKPCLTPQSEPQRRGRFLVWPANYANPLPLSQETSSN